MRREEFRGDTVLGSEERSRGGEEEMRRGRDRSLEEIQCREVKRGGDEDR